MPPLNNKEVGNPRTVLVVVPRRLGDVLLATPLVRTLRRAYPAALIDLLVFRGTESILEGNPDIHSVIAVPPKLSFWQSLGLLRKIWNRYDLAISTMVGDKPTLYAFVAGKARVGTVLSAQHWKARLFHWSVPFDNENTHTVTQNLKLALAIGLEAVPELVPPRSPDFEKNFSQFMNISGIRDSYVVLHPFPKFEYKKWTTTKWIDLGQKLHEAGLQVVISGGSEAEDQEECRKIAEAIPEARNLAGKLRLSEMTTVLSHAKFFVGMDTSVTHLAAAAGVKTIALFGPTNPIKWAPWPTNTIASVHPWVAKGSQVRGNVTLLQGDGDCVPCGGEGCDRHIRSVSRCLQEFAVQDVLTAIITLGKSKFT